MMMATRYILPALAIAAAFARAAAAADPLPETAPLTIAEPLDVLMVDGIDRFALREIAASVEERARLWNRDFSSASAYEKSIAPNREHLRTILGVVDRRATPQAIEMVETKFQPALRSEEHTSELQSRPHLVCRLLL